MLAVRGSTLPTAAWSPSASGRSPTSLTPPEEAALYAPYTLTYDQPPCRVGKRRVVSKKRGGKRIDILREVYPVDEPHEQTWLEQLLTELTTGSTKLSAGLTEVRRLTGLKLRAALTYDLIHNAWTLLDGVQSPGWSQADGTSLRNTFSARSLESNAVIAALLAVGALTSTHSAIIGQVRLTSDLSPDEVLALGLGRRREAAVAVLRARSVSIARDSGVLEASDAHAGEECALLATLALYFARYDPFVMELRDSMRVRREVAAQTPSIAWGAPVRGAAVGALVVSDALAGLVFNAELTVSEGDSVHFGLDQRSLREASERLKVARSLGAEVDEDVLADLRRCGVALMRNVVGLKRLPLDCALEPLVARFAALYAEVDLLLDLLCQSPQGTSQQPHHLKLPLMLDSTLASLAIKHAHARADDVRADKLLVKAQRRFLGSLARATNALYSTYCSSGQTASTVWNALDSLPEWDELAIEGARQSGTGEGGPLAGTGWNWEAFARTHTLLKLSTATFASSHGREKRFREAWEARQADLVENEQRSVLVRLAGLEIFGTRGLLSVVEGGVAERMVNQALVELGA